MIRELDKYLFTKMVVVRADQEIEEQLTNDLVKVIYLSGGEEIGVAIKKEDRLLRRWQILNKPTFTRVGMPLEIFKQEAV